MWCTYCNADLPGELSNDSVLVCTGCRQPVSADWGPKLSPLPGGPRTGPITPVATTSARELLARWSANDDEIARQLADDAASGVASLREQHTAAPPAEPRDSMRLPETTDAKLHRNETAQWPAPPPTPMANFEAAPRFSAAPRRLVKLAPPQRPRPSSWGAIFGQGLCLLGGLAISAGTAGLILKDTPAPADIKDWAWLALVLGQLILFTGLSGMVSTGLEEIREDLNARLDQLALAIDSPAEEPQDRPSRAA